MKLIQLFTFAAASVLVAMPLAANAKDLKIANDTKNNLSFTINSVCSPEFGTVESHSIKVILEKYFNKACSYSTDYCEVKVYNESNCVGQVIAKIVFEKTWGVVEIKMEQVESERYTITGNGYNLIFSSPLKK